MRAPGSNHNLGLRRDLPRSWRDWEPEHGLKRPEKGDSDSRSGRTSPTTAMRGATTHTTWRRAPRGLVENVETATGYGTVRTDSPPKGGEGGAWQRTAQTGSFGMKERWRGRVKRTSSQGMAGIQTGICRIVSSPGGQQGRNPGKQLASPRKLL